MPALNTAALTRFREALAAIWREGADDPAMRLGIAVSGGPDSLALLLLAAQALPGRIAAATVDHGLRPQSAAEADAVAAICADLNIPHAILPVTLAPGNLQSEARRARYGALEHWAGANGIAALATAHHADDQAETLLLRLNRASGVAGLAGTRARAVVPGGTLPVLRPVLTWRREELGAVVTAAGLVPADDPSNRDDRFDRARMRRSLAGADWLDIAAIAQSAAHIADADVAMDWAARREWAECVSEEGLARVYRPHAPRAIAMRVLTRLVTEMDGAEPRGGAIAHLFQTLVAGQPASIGGLVARPLASGWHFTRAPKRFGAERPKPEHTPAEKPETEKPDRG